MQRVVEVTHLIASQIGEVVVVGVKTFESCDRSGNGRDASRLLYLGILI